ncbi:ATP-dependent protease ClpP protease subunit [Acetoanaerobium pronyense]|uniref:ATP-dependent Clp protease proteolytic subunit n=1 Tax=Acetoanaerobium pronyense TaxID=1482736 RepID=A0ABS4KI00_9FIRM|nr:head maturation protease, ClpP-related [Acetoanaerobium pronyense]MBP2027407.1 ATP-dependent protease ClpP protease subunit [Acetoanaerobium pronyense]
MSKVLQLKNKDKQGNIKNVGKIEIRNESNDTAGLYFYGDIVSSEWEKWEDADTCPDDVLKFLKDIEGTKNLNIYINSGGGSVFAGMSIYNILKRNQAYKIAYIDGLAGSIASVIPFAADKIIIPANGYMMIHNAWSFTWGNAKELRKFADSLDVIDQGILNVYEANLKEGIKIEAIKQMMDNETWFTGKEAAEYFDIEVAPENKSVACVSDYFGSYTNIPDDLKTKEEIQPENKIDNNQIEKAKARLLLKSRL